MNELIAGLQGAMTSLDAEKNRTPFLDIAKGRIDAAVKLLGQHQAQLATEAKARLAQIEEKTAELEKLQQQAAS